MRGCGNAVRAKLGSPLPRQGSSGNAASGSRQLDGGGGGDLGCGALLHPCGRSGPLAEARDLPHRLALRLDAPGAMNDPRREHHAAADARVSHLAGAGEHDRRLALGAEANEGVRDVLPAHSLGVVVGVPRERRVLVGAVDAVPVDHCRHLCSSS